MHASCAASRPLTSALCRLEAYAALTSLRARRWADSSTRAVSVHFTLYNPPTRLFSCVTLSAELHPAGGLTLSSLVESVLVFHSDSAPRSHFILPEVSSPAARPPHRAQGHRAGTLHPTGLMPATHPPSTQPLPCPQHTAGIH